MFLLKLKVASYIETIGIDSIKKIMSQPFSFKMLDDKFTDGVSFTDWYFKDKGNYTQYINKTDNRIIIECNAITYKIINGREYVIPFHPKTIDQFITDCQRAGVTLYWNETILDLVDYQHLLIGKEIEEYHTNLLKRIEKFDEV